MKPKAFILIHQNIYQKNVPVSTHADEATKKMRGQSKQNVRSRTARETPQKQANSGKVVNNYFRELYRRGDGTHRALSCFLLFEVWVR